ncbi:Aste57867_21891 [Aphanomyces stellatus]|uniref:Eukaryotic translation initiation factor 3 subunit K n=1 Tax=Aphanomyces stellatus TaxID=120398 RepID=A0A485LIQ7_9STRA|nr:hypothetical protein As57867_021822 [Aphanomyces stellatus]VFT98559.1 Aste57867_21891 [Aphanomyces stellatus]
MSRSVSFETAPGAKAAAVKAQVEKDCMDESLIALLESYLDEQISTNVIDEEANMTLLKLYTIYPNAAGQQQARAAQILVKGLMTLPSNFFLGASYLVPDSLRKTKEIAELLQAGQLLQTCRFPDFWKLDLAGAKKVPGFEAAVRAFVVSTIGRSHDVVSAAFAAAQLHLGSKEVEALVAAQGWTVKGSDFVVKPNADNTMRPKKFKEDIEFTDLLDTINVLSR